MPLAECERIYLTPFCFFGSGANGLFLVGLGPLALWIWVGVDKFDRITLAKFTAVSADRTNKTPIAA
ncbi:MULTISPECIES: hypothetical protein [Aerosakkonema]|uniref:hypothetical protein n=1 Tax=Aerosakkonema TaxID=1246629 RepID=UPI0035BAB9ED